MPTRDLGFPIFDADNHMYETQEALTKFLPEAYAKAIEYIDIKGRTKIVVRGTISEYIPNPTFSVVAGPTGAVRRLTIENALLFFVPCCFSG